ncbi:MAG: aldehyde dehydrogenase family protein, partial [Pseudomonadota bacterium]
MKPHLINGEWRASTNAIENRNPSDLDDVIDVFADGTAEDTAAAIEAAKAAAPDWAISTPQVRHDILLGAAMEIRQRQKEIGWELSREEGKTLSEGIAEVGRAANIFDFFAGEAL